jgi:hypothetical protein
LAEEQNQQYMIQHTSSINMGYWQDATLQRNGFFIPWKRAEDMTFR